MLKKMLFITLVATFLPLNAAFALTCDNVWEGMSFWLADLNVGGDVICNYRQGNASGYYRPVNTKAYVISGPWIATGSKSYKCLDSALCVFGGQK